MVSSVYEITSRSLMTLASVNIDGTIGEAETAITHFFQSISSAEYNGTHLVFNLAFLFICYIIRYFSYFKIVNIDSSTPEGKKLYNRYRSYVINHILISAIFAYVICYILVKLANTDDIVIIWNIIVAPTIGYLASLWFDNEFLTKYENKYKILRNPLNEKDGGSDEKKSGEPVDQRNEINININNGEQSTDDKFVLGEDKKLSDDQKIEATINRIIEVQKEQSIILERHTNELKNQNTMLKNMQSLMKNNIKFELEDMIYACLDRGYATPAEDKKIRVKYSDYKANNGNGDLEDLYKSRYLELEVHEDRKRAHHD